MLLRTLAVLALLLHGSVVAAQTPKPGSALRGLRSVAVSVTVVRSPHAEAVAVDTAGLRVQVEQKLRRAGLDVDPSASAEFAVAVAIVSDTAGSIFAHHSSVSVGDWVVLLRDPDAGVVYATIWKEGGSQVGDAANLARVIPAAVVELTLTFVNEYLAANPARR